jgi:AcrR family transcriptional regulator
MHGLSGAERHKKPAGRPGKLRRRDINKADKRRRIREAALALFSSQGYEATTLRQIARRARVALGTLSLYADDKRDLVLLIFNEMVPRVIDDAAAAANKRSDLLDRLVAFFGAFYGNIASNITLARIHHQLNFYSTGSHTAEYNGLRGRVFALLEDMIRSAQVSGEIACRDDPTLIARYIFFSYSAAVRWWVASENLNLRAGLADLRQMLQLQINGLIPAPAGRTKPRRRKQTKRRRG